MLQELEIDLRAAQGFGPLLLLVGGIGYAFAAMCLGWRKSRAKAARRAAVGSFFAGALACTLGIGGALLFRAQTSAATASPSDLAPSAVERVRYEGDVLAQRVAELGVVAGLLPLFAGFFVLRRETRSRWLVLATLLVAGGIVVVWVVPPRGRRLDRRMWAMLDAKGDADAGRLGVACAKLQSLPGLKRRIAYLGRGPNAPETADMAPEQIITLIPDGSALVDRCVDDMLWRYQDIPSLFAGLERFGWMTPERRAYAERAFVADQAAHPPPPPPSSPPSRKVELVSGHVDGEHSDMWATALFDRISPRLANCYDLFLESQPRTSARLKLRITVEGFRATKIGVEGTSAEALRSCVRREVEAAGLYDLHTDSATTARLDVSMVPY